MRPIIPKPVERAEHIWALRYAIFIVIVTSMPYFLGFSTQGEEWRFSGFLIAVEDGNSYIAKMLRGAMGDWQFRTPYTPLPQSGAWIYLPYLLLGKLAAGNELHLQLVAIYHLFRVVSGLFVIWIMYQFISLFVPDPKLRKIGLVFASIGGGGGWLLVLLGKEIWLDSLPLEFYSPESFGFLSLYALPHLAFARGLLLLSIIRFLREEPGSSSIFEGFIKGIVSGFLLLVAGFFQPIVVLIAFAVMGIYIIAWVILSMRCIFGIDSEKNLVRYGVKVVGYFVVPLPLVVYTGWVFATDEFLRAWGSQNLILSPHPLQYLVAYGVMLPLVGGGVYQTWKTRRVNNLLPVLWVVLLPLLVYFPYNVQRRFAEGGWLIIVILSLWSVSTGLGTAKSKGHTLARLWMGFALVYSSISTIVILTTGVFGALNPAKPAFRPQGEIAAFGALDRSARPGEIVLTAYATGNALPAYAPLRVVIGHGPESINLSFLDEEVVDFFSDGISDIERKRILDTYHVQYVFWGPEERLLGSFDPSSVDYLYLIYISGDYSVFGRVPAP